MTTALDMVNIAKFRYLLSDQTEQRNQLAASYTAGQTTLAFKYGMGSIAQGAVLAIGTNVFYVWSANSVNQTCVVEGGYRGAVDVNLATGTDVNVNPRYTENAILQALNEELASLSSPSVGLFQMLQTEFAYQPSQVGYDLPGVTGLTSVYLVRYAEQGPADRDPRLNQRDWRLERNNLLSEDSSTYSLKLFKGGAPGRNITVVYKAPFTPLASLTADVATTGLPVSAYDLPPMGAAWRLGAGKEVRRNQTQSQGDTRRAEEVGPGAVAASWRGIQALRQQRIREEVQRLQAAYPSTM